MQDSETLATWRTRLAEGIREEWVWLAAGQALVGLVLLGAELGGWLPESGLSGFVGSFLIVYAALQCLQQPGLRGLGESFQRRLHAAIASSGVGFYGAVVLARFLQLELHDLLDAASGFEASRHQIATLVREWVIGFSVDSLMNSIQAMTWPFRMFAAHGWQKALLVLGSLWLLYRFGAWLFPELHRQIEAEKAEASSSEPPEPPPPPPPA